jgi:transposase-like protein
MRGYPRRRRRLDEAFVKMNGQLSYLRRAVERESEVLESVVAASARHGLGVEASQARHEDIWPTTERRRAQAAMKETGDRREVRRRFNNRGEFASVVSATRTRHAAIYTREDATKIQLSTSNGPDRFQSGRRLVTRRASRCVG